MAFDMGFNFRATAGYVTDNIHYAVPALGEAYPHTYTNGDGQSINAGTNGSWQAPLDRNAGNDSRIAGMYYQSNDGSGPTFQVDLSSGSAPGAGTYTVDFAAGDPGGTARPEDFKLFDNATLLIDGTNGGAGIDTGGSNAFIDATLSVVAGGAAWNGVTVNKTFATTTVLFQIAIDAIGNLTCFSHFRLTLQAAATGWGPLLSHARNRSVVA